MVTSAKCTDGLGVRQIMVRLGDTSLDEEFEAQSFTIRVKRIKQHPNYDRLTGLHDIAVLELYFGAPESPEGDKWVYPNIRPICLPEAGALFPGEAVVSGWGFDPNISHSYLNEVNVTVFADGDCGNMNEYMTDHEYMICAGHKEGGKDVCKADDGGPLVAMDPARDNSMSLVGVVSITGCGDPAYSGLSIYTEVSAYIDWLSEQMPDLNTCLSNGTKINGSLDGIQNNEGRCGNCNFPFIWQGRKSDRCTTVNGQTKPWCPFTWDSVTGDYLAGENCTDPSCPGLEGNSEEMSVHPENAVGNCCTFFC